MKKCLMMMLLIVLLMPMIYATPQETVEPKEPTASELYSTINPDSFYLGAKVIWFADMIIEEAAIEINKAYNQGVIEGVAMVARPLKARIDGLEAWQDEAKKKLAFRALKTLGFVLAGAAAGWTIGALTH